MTLTRRELLTTAAPAAALAGLFGAGVGRVMASEAARFDRRLPGGEWHFPAESSLLPFGHGVASGDPLHDRVILWTRITIPDARGWDVSQVPDPQGFREVSVGWVIATDPGLGTVVNRGVVTTDASRDFTVKIDADGLDSATTYWFAFTALGFRSPIGRTRTAPKPGDAVSEITIAHAACSSWWTDWFNGYARMAERGDLDLITHAGDHIYEVSGNHMASRFYPGPDGQPQTRGYEDIDNRAWRNVGECRRRYALYYQGAEMIAAHAAAPFFILPDQHDYTGFVDDGTGSDSRVAAAGEVMYEWCPMRAPLPDGSGRFAPSPGPNVNLPIPRGDDAFYSYRTLPFGDLADLLCIDARRHTDPQAENSVLLGDAQWDWLLATLEDSGRRGVKHRVILNQSNLSQLGVDLGVLTGPLVDTLQPIIEAQQADLGSLGFGGFPNERTRLYQFLRDRGVIDNIVLSGNIHGFFGSDLIENSVPPLYVPGTALGLQQIVGVEMVASAMGRPGLQDILADELYWAQNGGRENAPFDDAETYDRVHRPAALPLAQAGQLAILAGTPTLRYLNWLAEYGYSMVHLRETEAYLENWTTPQRMPSPEQRLLSQHRTVVGDPRLQAVAAPTPIRGARQDPSLPPETVPLASAPADGSGIGGASPPLEGGGAIATAALGLGAALLARRLTIGRGDAASPQDD